VSAGTGKAAATSHGTPAGFLATDPRATVYHDSTGVQQVVETAGAAGGRRKQAVGVGEFTDLQSLALSNKETATPAEMEKPAPASSDRTFAEATPPSRRVVDGKIS